jgi:aryl-alcohol dehydrogenase-like predicted oxidoreductase
MRILFPGDRELARGLLRRALELGVNLIDTADAYGPGTSEEVIAEALHPYPEDLVVATKGGQVHDEQGRARPDGRPEHLREACEASLRRLRLERIDLYQLHSPDPEVPLEESLGALVELRAAGKIRHIGVSNVFGDQLALARSTAPIVSVQNRYNAGNRAAEASLEFCEREGIAFLPWAPLGAGALAPEEGPLAAVAGECGATPAQVALAWLLRRSPVVLPIPGTSSAEHLEENMGATRVRLSDAQANALAEGC